MPYDILFDRVTLMSIKINGYFLIKKLFAYIALFAKSKKWKHSKTFKRYYCFNFYMDKNKYEKHAKICNGILGVLYTFDCENLMTTEVNLK